MLRQKKTRMLHNAPYIVSIYFLSCQGNVSFIFTQRCFWWWINPWLCNIEIAYQRALLLLYYMGKNGKYLTWILGLWSWALKYPPRDRKYICSLLLSLRSLLNAIINCFKKELSLLQRNVSTISKYTAAKWKHFVSYLHSITYTECKINKQEYQIKWVLLCKIE